jgi:hypothetical protein
MNTILFSRIILACTIALYTIGLITLCLGLFNTAMMAFFFALGSLGAYTITKSL